MPISHEEQREKWNKEHARPHVLVQMDKREPSSSILLFINFLKKQSLETARGVEMGCGKGRNVIALAKEDFVSRMYGFDFSDIAVAEAKKRAAEEGVTRKTDFRVMDATKPWDFPSGSFDFGIDCAVSTDIESERGRAFSASEMLRVLKPGGYFLVYVMSTDDEYHRLMRQESPAEEMHAFYHPETGKFEKVFTEGELDALHAKFRIVEKRRIPKQSRFFWISYATKMHWRIYQKPLE